MPTEKQLLKELDKDTVDTSRWSTRSQKDNKYFMEVAESKLYGLAIPQPGGYLRAWHVTDDPDKVVEMLRNRGDFYAREGDLCGGLYVSGVPHFWAGRSNRKWDFLPRLSKEARGTLYQAIYDRLVDEIKSGYITQGEFERAESSMAQAMTGDYWQVLDIVANQPFNVDIIGIAEHLGLATAFKPPHVQVDFIGRYLEFNTKRAIEANEALLRLTYGRLEGLTRTDLCNMLKDYGWDGVYTKSSMGTNPELVIWSGDKIVAFGDWVQESGAEMSGPAMKRGYWIIGKRFHAWIQPGGEQANINDTLLRGTFTDLTREEIFEMQRMLRDPIGEQRSSRRFTTRRLYNIPQIYDKVTKYYFRALGDADIADLKNLLDEVLKALVL